MPATRGDAAGGSSYFDFDLLDDAELQVVGDSTKNAHLPSPFVLNGSSQTQVELPNSDPQSKNLLEGEANNSAISLDSSIHAIHVQRVDGQHLQKKEVVGVGVHLPNGRAWKGEAANVRPSGHGRERPQMFDPRVAEDGDGQPPELPLSWKVVAGPADVKRRKDAGSPTLETLVQGSLFWGTQDGEWVTLAGENAFVKIIHSMTREVVLRQCEDIVEISVEDVSGPSASCANGIYVQTGEVVNERDVYAKRGPSDAWIAFLNSKWFVCTSTQKNSNVAGGWLFSEELYTISPATCSRWMAWTGKDWELQSQITIKKTAPQHTRPRQRRSTCEWSAACPPGIDPALGALVAQCRAVGLCAEWCSDLHKLLHMLATAKKWNAFGFAALKTECTSLGAPADGYLEREQILERMRLFLAWRMMSTEQLQSECRRRGIPFFTNARRSAVVAVEGELEMLEQEERFDLISRLRQDTFACTPGPLPVHGIQGVWHPNQGQQERPGEKPSLRRAWTGAPAAGLVDLHCAPLSGPETIGGTSPSAPPKPNWSCFSDAGPRLRAILKEFPRFSGVLPGPEAEATWSVEQLRSYFYSNGVVKPKPPPPPAWTWRHEEPTSTTPKTDSKRNTYGPNFDRSNGRQPQQGRPSTAKRMQVHSHLAKHFQTLGLEPDASMAAVKKIFRQLALQHHPDKKGAACAGVSDSDDFRRISEAYDALRSHLGKN